MPDRLMDRIDDGLAMRLDLLDAVIEVENPIERLLRRCDVVRLGAEDDDRRSDVAQVNPGAVTHPDFTLCEPVADEELIDDELHFLGVERYMPAPPPFKSEIAVRLGIDLRIEIVLLAPECIRR